MMNAHPNDERLNDWVDGLLEAADAEAVAAHVANCAACRDAADRLRALLSMTSELPDSIEPPVGTWEAIAERTVDLGRTRRLVLRDMRLPLAAAAAVLVAVTAGATALLMRADEAASAAAPVAGTAPATGAEGNALLVSDVEQTYQVEFDRLMTEFRARSDSLDPATVAVVEENLRIIDGALRQARAALEADPGNRQLPLYITETHRQRIAVVERALRLSSRSERSEA